MLAAIANGTLALGAGTALALGAALVVLVPLWRDEEHAPDDAHRSAPADLAVRAEAEQASAVEALREIEFDRATGKLSDGDYAVLKATYTREALAELRAKSATAHGAPEASDAAAEVGDDAVETALADFRRRRSAAAAHGCPQHGPRPEVDAAFCSECGRYLVGPCPACGAACAHVEQRFCEACGHALAG